MEKVLDIPDPVTNSEMIAVIARVAGANGDTYDSRVTALKDMGILTEKILQHIGAENDIPMVAEAVMIIANLYTFMVQ